ncbi:MAG: SDR family NAD(P)-dependent oxidoreductase [Gammaproteobacteria bacterium]
MKHERVIVVTGGASGLGAALVTHFAARGDAVTLNYRDDAKAKSLLGALADTDSDSHVLPVKADVTDRAQVRKMFDRTIDRFGKVDVLVHSAGVNRDTSFLDMTDAAWDEVTGAHLRSAFICAQEYVFHNPKNAGHIITLGAACAFQGRRNGANFCSAKGGVITLTKCLALELAPRIQVNCVVPGSVDTAEVRERYHLDTEAGLNKVLSRIPMGRLGERDDFVHVVESILGSRFTTGENFFVNGGEYMH